MLLPLLSLLPPCLNRIFLLQLDSACPHRRPTQSRREFAALQLPLPLLLLALPLAALPLLLLLVLAVVGVVLVVLAVVGLVLVVLLPLLLPLLLLLMRPPSHRRISKFLLFILLLGRLRQH